MKANTRFGNQRLYKGRMPDGRGNSTAKKFTVIRDPNDIFSEGAVLGILDIQFGIHDHVFADGTSFDTSDGRLRVDRGVLVHAGTRKRYYVAVPHV